MTLSEFKGWLLDYKLRFVDGKNNPDLVAMVAVIREKLASVEDFVCDICKWSQVNEKGFTLHYKEDDGVEDKNQLPEITCPCCDALFKVGGAPRGDRAKCEDCNEPLYPAPGTSKCLACYETCVSMKETHDTLARQYHNAAINDLITTKEPL